MPDIGIRPLEGTLAERFANRPAPGVRVYWLGQAGFVVEAAGFRLLIDPYLSNSLGEKYRGARFSHDRMMPAPVDVAGLAQVDLVLSTHHHTDHMDPATLKPLLASRPDTRFVAPAASEAQALERSGISKERLILADAGERKQPLLGLVITATPAAHEARERDVEGRHRFLGYVIEAEGLRLWHSGDCMPFDGLVESVLPLKPDVALLPVNGRRPELSRNGVPGNFTLEEAIETAQSVGARTMIAHHYGMFAFNTADPSEIDAAALQSPVRVIRARTGEYYALEPSE